MSNKKYIILTPDVEKDVSKIGERIVSKIKNFRRKNPNADLSVYKIKTILCNENI